MGAKPIKRQPIILCAGADGRAVIYGYVDSDPVPGEPVTLHEARMILYWDAKCGGLFGLAARGPRGDTRITAPVARTVATRWQEYVDVTAEDQINGWSAV